MRIHWIALLAVALPLAAQQPWNQSFPPDKPAPKDFHKNRTSYSALMEVLARSRPAISDAQINELRGMQLENIWGGMGEYRETNYARGFQSTRPGERLVGRALTMRFLPSRPDLDQAARQLADEAGLDRRLYIRAGEEAKPGDVVVVALGGESGGNFFGDVTALGIKMTGAAGVLIDGGTRDLAELSDDSFTGFPVFARFFDIHGNTWVGTEWNVPIRVGTVTVIPGDIIVGDESGVLVIPPQLVQPILDHARSQKAKEDYERDLVRQKKYRMRDVYPLHPKLQEEFEKQKKP